MVLSGLQGSLNRQTFTDALLGLAAIAMRENRLAEAHRYYREVLRHELPEGERVCPHDGAALRGYVERDLLARSPIAGLAAAAFPSRTAAIPDVQAEIAEVVLSLLERPAA